MTETHPFDADAMARAITRIKDLRQTEPRSKLQSLLPTIDGLVRQGVSHDAIVNALRETGLPLNLQAMRKALYRWRKRQTSASFVEPRAAPLAPPSHSTHQPPPSSSTKSPPPTATVTSKADLVELRKSKEPIDLNALAELGRQK